MLEERCMSRWPRADLRGVTWGCPVESGWAQHRYRGGTPANGGLGPTIPDTHPREARVMGIELVPAGILLARCRHHDAARAGRGGRPVDRAPDGVPSTGGG